MTTKGDEEVKTTEKYQAKALLKLLRKTPSLGTFDKISSCVYCKRALTRGAPSRSDRPEVEHIVEVQAFADLIKEVYGDRDDKSIVELPIGRLSDYVNIVNSNGNLAIACGNCNMKKMHMQKSAIKFKEEQSPSLAFEPKLDSSFSTEVSVGDPEVTMSICVDALKSISSLFAEKGIPLVHARNLAVKALSLWTTWGDEDFFVMWMQNQLGKCV